MRKVAEISDKVQAARNRSTRSTSPTITSSLWKRSGKYPPDVVRAVEKPESERTPGEKLVAIQMLESGVSIRSAAVDKIMSPEDAAKKKALNDEIAALNADKQNRFRWRRFRWRLAQRKHGLRRPQQGRFVRSAKRSMWERASSSSWDPARGTTKFTIVLPLRGDPDSKAYPTSLVLSA